MSLPTSLYIMPTEDLDESDNLDGDELLTYGWDTPPPPGAQLVVVPSDPGQLTREIRWIYTVESSKPNDNKDWPWVLGVKGRKVGTPRPWYDLVRESQVRGLVQLSGAPEEGEKIVHRPTIEMIYEMLGEA